jgi:CRP/FNR family cyclic AMP-dependent transcriptional regulator
MSTDTSSSSKVMDGLRNSSIFSGCDEAALESLADACRVRTMPKGSMVFFQSDPAGAFYLVLSGSFAILLSSLDGRELQINEALPGDYFGELSIITGQPRSASAMAREKSELLVIPALAFQQVLDAEPKVVRNLLRMTALRLSISGEREAALAFLDAPGRIVRNLLQLDMENEERGYMILSQEELAQRTGLTRQTVAKILGRWRRAGWLLTGRGRIMLLNREALKKVAEQSSL